MLGIKKPRGKKERSKLERFIHREPDGKWREKRDNLITSRDEIAIGPGAEEVMHPLV